MSGIPRRVGGHTWPGCDRAAATGRASERMPAIGVRGHPGRGGIRVGTLSPCASPISATPASSSRSPTPGSSSTPGRSRPGSRRCATSTPWSSPISTPTTSTRNGCRTCWRSTVRPRSSPTRSRRSCSTETSATSSSSPRARSTASGRRRSGPSGSSTPSTTTRVPRCTNVGVVLQADGEPSLYHPGDAYDGEPGEVDVLAVPLNAPWAQGRRDDRLRPAGGAAADHPHPRRVAVGGGTPALPRARRGLRRRRPHRPQPHGRPRRRHHPRLSRAAGYFAGSRVIQ